MSSSPPPPVAPPLRGIPNPRRAAEVSQIVLAILACGAAFTYLGPVLQPFLVAVFLYHAIHFLMRLLTGLRMSQVSAFLVLTGLGLIISILLAQFVYRESELFRKSWPRYEDRIVAFLGEWSPGFLHEPHRSAGVTAADWPAGRHDDGSVASHVGVTGRGSSVGHGSTPAAGSQAESPATELTPDLVGEKPVAGGAGSPVPVNSDQATRSVAPPALASPPGSQASPATPVERTPLARSGLTDLFRLSSQDVLNYVFSHGMDAIELIVMVFFYLVFLFIGSRKFAQRIMRAFPGERGERVLAVGQGISESMERFMMVKTVVGLGMAITSALIMWFFGLDHWLLWAFLFFASNYITYIGSIAACVPPCVMAFLDLDSSMVAALLGGLIIVNRLFWIDYVELKMSGRQLNLDPTLLFLWLAYWGWAWGILGLILAYPMMAAVRIALLHIEEARGWSVMLSDE